MRSARSHSFSRYPAEWHRSYDGPEAFTDMSATLRPDAPADAEGKNTYRNFHTSMHDARPRTRMLAHAQYSE